MKQLEIFVNQFELQFNKHHGWLPVTRFIKLGYDNILKDKTYFNNKFNSFKYGLSQPQFKAIRYWLLAFKIATEYNGELYPTKLGEALFKYDPYLENPASAILLHYNLLKPPSLAPSWFILFNHYNQIKFENKSMVEFIKNKAKTKVAISSLSKDIKCIQLIGRVRNAGFRLTVQDIFTDQTIDKLALKLKKIETESDQSMVKGTAKLSPIQQLFWERETPDKHHYNQSVLLRFSKGISEQFAKKIFQKIQLHHDVLRSVFITGDHEIKQDIRGAEMPVSLEFFDLKDENDPEAFLSAKLDQIQSGIDLRQGPLMKLGLFQRENESLLAIVIHHLVVDGVSWRILLEDIETLYRQLQDGKQLSLASKTDSILSWSEQLARYVKSEQFEIGRSYWSEQKKRTIPSIPRDNSDRDNRVKNVKTVSFHLNENDTHKLLTHVNVPFKTEVNDILLAAILMSSDRCFNL